MSRPIRRALISVSDKHGLVELASALQGQGIELLSTGGTARVLAAAGITAKDVSSHTGFPEIMDGRVKTLHPRIHGGLLFVRGNADHEAACAIHGIGEIDLLIVNLYPFEKSLADGAQRGDLVENIDVGGPAMIRAAAKNHADVTVIVDPADYGLVLAELKDNNGCTSLQTRKLLAARAFARTAAYDSMISNWLLAEANEAVSSSRALGGQLISKLRYGENPHQEAGFYRTGEKRAGVATARQLQGKELSYNNINDTDAAYECVAELGADVPACVIVKHANPCGAAHGSSLVDAYRKALACDPVSAFGGIIAFNQILDEETAAEVCKLFTEVIIAPGATDGAKVLIGDKKNLRLLLADGLPDPREPGMSFKSVAGGMLVQSRDSGLASLVDLKIVTRRRPTDKEISDLLFANKIVKHVKSNAIVYVKDLATIGIGAGQMSRLDASRIAAIRAEALAPVGSASPLMGSVVASDAFFPFADGLLAAAEAGATAVIQPGGSVRDDEIIKAADNAGLAMAFTGIRHFKH